MRIEWEVLHYIGSEFQKEEQGDQRTGNITRDNN